MKSGGKVVECLQFSPRKIGDRGRGLAQQLILERLVFSAECFRHPLRKPLLGSLGYFLRLL